MNKNKLLVSALMALVVLSTGAACSKKKANNGGDVVTEANSNLKRIHFDFDKYNVRSDAIPTMKENASWLKSNPNTHVIVEGHCDEIGTNEYNMALGERRAKAAKDYLVNLGVTSSIETVSFGEEKPLDPGHNEAAYSTNRRAEFVVRKK
ncbi:MAG: peptidoglycan-associated lipoprotein Pal [Deltaproteobacteria bacterium]|nr:peptidoglycan-associated lipoprotein Pal [Deltaproteobacteria bacterium]